MVAWLAGDPNLTLAYNHSTHPLAACLLAIAYVFILGLVLLNLLVGLMTNTLNKVTENESLRLLLSKAQIIDELEATLPRWVPDLGVRPGWHTRLSSAGPPLALPATISA